MGLGSFPSVPLAEAREKARAHRAKVDEGADPILARQAALSAAAAQRNSQPDFRDGCRAVHRSTREIMGGKTISTRSA